jgi:hypothetical protein
MNQTRWSLLKKFNFKQFRRVGVLERWSGDSRFDIYFNNPILHHSKIESLKKFYFVSTTLIWFLGPQIS